MGDPQKKPTDAIDDLQKTYEELVTRGEFAFGEPKNQGSSVAVFIGAVRRVARNFNSSYVFVRPKIDK